MSTKNLIVSKMSAKLNPEWIKTLSVPNRPTLSYVPIDKTIKYLNDNFGDSWYLSIERVDWQTYGANGIGVTVVVNLHIMNEDSESTRSGIGSDFVMPKDSSRAIDTDKMVKTAYANAFKKATNMFGFACELWDEDNVNHKSEQNSQMPNPPQAVFTEEAKQKVAHFLIETKLSKTDLEDFLKEFKPESDGNPLYLCKGDLIKNLDEFFAHIKKQLKK
jgi:hypothetical protein